MNKKVIGSIAVLAIAAMTAFNVNVNTQENGLSDISLDNVEALASESSEEFYDATGSKAVWENTNCKGKDGKTTYSYASKI